ncbi:glutamyl-tRNA amidotransferase [Listeria monocytogenes]|nr:glutamyl-tRNA amidotransferase [Listeria monocytogenes]EAE7988123.1 glutamyl-tRNA amidotransferase [Listeria monocytogenes]EAE8110226.1 glutamyl-tRNA amidotransferase [Listeria monocytogenes]ELB7125504.1 glutamyl-tRNA amidotransferase [Listeria monocytogenes]ELB8382553.1 glutamyl-tRNA amidotransferase [Listeria monocytogenes]
MIVLSIEMVIVILIIFGIINSILLLDILSDQNQFSDKSKFLMFILLLLSISVVIYLWNLDLSIRDDTPKKWIAIEVQKLPDEDKGLTGSELIINYSTQNPYVVYKDVKYPKLIIEKLVYTKEVPMLKSYIKKRLKIVLPKNYDTDKRS